jgi:hypothetical protein
MSKLSISEIDIVELLKEAAKSELGIIALVILSLSVVGVILFRRSADKFKFGVFVFLIVGVTTFAYASIQLLQPVDQRLANTENDGIAKLLVPDLTLQTIDLSNVNATPVKLEEGYVFLGSFKNGKWSDPRFSEASSTGSLKVGDRIVLSESRKMFTCVPFRKTIFSLKYTFCNDVIGKANKGQAVEVAKIPELIGLNRAWVYVREIE